MCGLVLLPFCRPGDLYESKRIVDFAAKSRLPSIYQSSEFADAGGL